MFSFKHYINNISLLILSIIAFLITYKFLLNFVERPLAISILYVIFFLTIIFFLSRDSSGLKSYVSVILALYVFLPFLLTTYFFANINRQQIWIENETLIYFVITAALFYLSNKYVDFKKYNFTFFIFSVLFGIILSLNFSVGFILIINLLFLFRYSFPKIFISSIIILFIGLIISRTLMILEPGFIYKIYFPEIPLTMIIFLIIVSIYIGWIISDLQELFFASGIILFIYLFIPLLSNIFQIGFYNVVKSDFLISTIICLIPFFLLSIKDYKVEKFTGKILEKF